MKNKWITFKEVYYNIRFKFLEFKSEWFKKQTSKIQCFTQCTSTENARERSVQNLNIREGYSVCCGLRKVDDMKGYEFLSRVEKSK